MIDLNRRGFLVGLFGTAAVAAAGPLPKVFETAPLEDFKHCAYNIAKVIAQEIYGDDKGHYGFATITWLDKHPYFQATPPEGMRPLGAESRWIADRILEDMKANPEKFRA